MTKELLETIIAGVKDELPQVRVCRLIDGEYTHLVVVLPDGSLRTIYALSDDGIQTGMVSTYCTRHSDLYTWIESLPEANEMGQELLGQYIHERDEADGTIEQKIAALDG